MNYLKYILTMICIMGMIKGQDITYTNDNVQLVDEISPDEGIVEDESLFSIHGNWTSQFRYNNVLGTGADDSLKDEGFFHSHSLNLDIQTQLYDDIFLQLNVAVRYDEQQGAVAENISLDNLLVRIFKANVFEIQIGDISPRFSHYTLEQSLEGFLGSYIFSFGGKAISLTGVVAQIPKDFKGGDQRYVLGYRFEALELLSGLILGLDQVFINDRDVEVNEQDVSVISFNGIWNLPHIEGTEVYWDLGTSFNLQDSGDNVPSQQDGYAIRSGFRYRGANRANFNLEYEEVSYDFVSPVASAGTDKRSILLSGGYAFLENWDMQASYSFVRDNLYGQLNQTTRVHRIDWNTNYSPFFASDTEFVQNLQLSQNIGYTKRFDKVTVDSEIWDFTTSLNNRFRNFNVSANYTLSLFRDEETDDTDSNSQSFQTELGYNGQFLGGAFDTSVYFRIADELFKRDRDERNITRVHGWRIRNNWNQQYEISGNVEYQRLNRIGDNFEGETYRFLIEGRYITQLAVGRLNASLLVEYAINNFDLDEEAFDELRVLMSVSYGF